MEYWETVRLKLLILLDKNTDVSKHKIEQEINQNLTFLFNGENLWDEKNINGVVVYNISQKGKEVYKFLKRKKEC